MNILVANLGATAYHFLIHEYKIVHSPTFKEDDFENFIHYFYEFAKASGYSLTDKEGNEFTQEKMIETILDNYVDYTTNDMGNRVCYFSSDNIDEIRNDYEKCNFAYKILIYRLEENLAKENYSNKQIYSLIEDHYKKSLKSIEKEDNKHLA